MTEGEWSVIAALIENWWPATEFDEGNEAAYFDVLRGFESADVEAAVREQLEQNNAFAPSAAQLLGSVRAIQGEVAPQWGDVWAWVVQAMERWPSNERTALHWLMTKHEWAAQWAEVYGWRRLVHEPIHGENGGAILARLEKDWTSWCKLHREHTRSERAIAAVGSRRGNGQLERVKAGDVIDAAEPVQKRLGA